MGRYILRRILQSIPVLFGISLITFLIVNTAPGDPALLYMDRSSNPTQEDIDRVREELGLDKPLPQRYLEWVGRAMVGDFGTSFKDKRPVIDRISETLPYSIKLSVISIVFGYVMAILLGILAAVKANSWVDYIISFFSALFVSAPVFWVALMAILVFSVKLDLLPTSGWSDYGDESLWNVARHLILPVTILALRDIAGMSRYVRSGLLEVLRADYVRTARSKGLQERVVIFKHALRNSLIPVVTVMGLSLPALVGGAVLTETVFGLPGMGRLAVGSIANRDYPMLIAINLLSAVMVVLGNILADAAYGWVDPRIRYN
ncbi:MAG TPA: ABC transporter permease [Symbiobacteriaceae bacterium]|nr:ABC transporter permease [Symbiobacteriaceae bacterium]